MSLNRYEQGLFDYWGRNADEEWHWRAKTLEAARAALAPGEAARRLERELWEHFRERCEHVPALRALQAGGLPRVSLLNLAELILRLWGPPPKPRPRHTPPPA